MIQEDSSAAFRDAEAVRMTDADFDRIAKIALREFGLSLTDSKKSLVFSRLGRRLRTLGLPDFAAYFALLESPQGTAEMTNLLTTLTTNVTKFFRESHHFDTLRDEVLPELVERAKSGGRVRLWSAACSSGPEVYSMAMVLLDLFPQAATTNTKILATDIDPAILEKAKAGRYDAIEKADIPAHLAQRYTKAAPDSPDQFLVTPQVKELITFGVANLVAKIPVSGPFDVIFCRNVAIYFDKPTQALVWDQLARLLAPGGYIFIGHSERISGPASENLINTGITTYRKA